MDLTTTKIVVAILFGIIRFFFGILPIKIYKILRQWEDQADSRTFINERRHAQVNCAIALCQSFGGGVLFATCFLHMMVDVYFSLEQLTHTAGSDPNSPLAHLSQLIVCCGFFFVYFMEEISHWFINDNLETCRIERIEKKIRTRKVTPKRIVVTPKETVPQLEDKLPPYTIEDNMKNPSPETVMEKVSLSSSVAKENQKNLEAELSVPETPETADELEVSPEGEVKSLQQVMRYVFVVLALSLHAIFEGIAIGIQRSKSNIWYLFVAVVVHSITILFCIGLELLLAKAKCRNIYIQMFALAMASPLGVIIGLIFSITSDDDSTARSLASVLLEGFSAGTIVYITFFEILNREKERRVYRLRRGLCILAGFTMMAILDYIHTTH